MSGKSLGFGRVALGLAFVLGLGVGIHVFKNHGFPYELMKSVAHSISLGGETKPTVQNGPWSIGIYEGRSPFSLSPAQGATNPVFSGEDVTDFDATFVADPFLIRKDGKFFMFFEALDRAKDRGVISYGESVDGKAWDYKKVVLDEPFHLSYPHVFEWAGETYLIPESHEDLSVRLYRAKRFPDQWEFVTKIVSGYHFVDPTVLRHNDKWWLFVATRDNSELNIYHSDELTGEWKPHAMNPVIRGNKHIARPAGRFLIHEGQPVRFAQDDFPKYGLRVLGFKITELTETSYKEAAVSKSAILEGTGKGWNSVGMHQIDVLKVGDGWIAAVDGRER